MKKLAWAIGVALVGAALAAVRARWRILEILSSALWGALPGFLIGLAAEIESDVKARK